MENSLVKNAFSCLSGGLSTVHPNELRGITVRLLTEHIVEVEPSLQSSQSVSGESF